MLASSAPGITHPVITSSSSSDSNGCRASSARPAAKARSDAENGPGLPHALIKGVRLPSTTKTSFSFFNFIVLLPKPAYFHNAFIEGTATFNGFTGNSLENIFAFIAQQFIDS
jgi:hypothetical protein